MNHDFYNDWSSHPETDGEGNVIGHYEFEVQFGRWDCPNCGHSIDESDPAYIFPGD